MKAILLAAGRGSRLHNLTINKPKCLVEINGYSLLDWLIASLKAADINDIWIVSGYRSELLDRFGFQRLHNTRWSQANMVASLQCAAKFLESSDTLVSYTDILYMPETVEQLVQTSAPIALSYDPQWLTLWKNRFENPLEDAERFQIDSTGRVIDIGGRATDTASIQGQYMGLLKFTPLGWQYVVEVLTQLPMNSADLLDMTGLLSLVLAQTDITIQSVPAVGGWCEIDHPSDIPIGEDFVRNNLSRKVRVKL